MDIRKSIVAGAALLAGTLAVQAQNNATSQAQNIEGEWQGNLRVNPAAELKLVFHFAPGSFTLDSPQQGAKGIPGELIYLSADSVNVAVRQIGMTYAGHREGNEIRGAFKQGPLSLPLVLTQGEGAPKRPQTPQPPFPYSTREMTFTNGDARLTGTLTMPENFNPASTPTLVMVTGSGQQNRDEELFGHKPFHVIADYLARNGIATLRYDDRGTASSTGSVIDATTATFAADALAAVKSLRKDGVKHVGVLGHSEGARIAFSLAASGNADFIVALGAPAMRGDSIIVAQNLAALRQLGATPEQTEPYGKTIAEILKARIAGNKAKAIEIATKADIPEQSRPALVELAKSSNVWYDYFLADSPVADIKATKCPAFAAYGSLDTQVCPDNAEAMRSLAPKVKVKLYPGLNHLMQHAKKGTVDEYYTIEETISPEVLADIAAFVNSLK